MKVVTYDHDADPQSPRGIIVNALRENARPVGFAPWPEEPKPKKAKKRRKK